MFKQFYQIIMNLAMHNLWRTKELHVDGEQSLEGLRDETQTSVISVVLKEESKYGVEQVTPVHSISEEIFARAKNKFLFEVSLISSWNTANNLPQSTVWLQWSIANNWDCRESDMAFKAFLSASWK